MIKCIDLYNGGSCLALQCSCPAEKITDKLLIYSPFKRERKKRERKRKKKPKPQTQQQPSVICSRKGSFLLVCFRRLIPWRYHPGVAHIKEWAQGPFIMVPPAEPFPLEPGLWWRLAQVSGTPSPVLLVTRMWLSLPKVTFRHFQNSLQKSSPFL